MKILKKLINYHRKYKLLTFIDKDDNKEMI